MYGTCLPNIVAYYECEKSFTSFFYLFQTEGLTQKDLRHFSDRRFYLIDVTDFI